MKMSPTHLAQSLLLALLTTSLASGPAVASAAGAAAASGQDPAPQATTQSTDAAVSTTDDMPDVAQVGRVDRTLRAQILLERAHFSPGVIDGATGGNTRRALRAYQSAHGLSVTGEADDATLESLGGVDAVVLTRKRLSAEEVAGPFNATPDGPEAMSKVDALPYASVEEKLAEQFHVTPQWLRERNPGITFEAGATLTVPSLDGASELPTPARIVVDESDKSLLLQDEAGRVIAHFPVTTGSAQFPLPIGEWKVTSVATNPVWYFDPDLIAGTSADAKKAEVPPGPNNPVGVVWIDLSKEHYGIHGTPDPSRIGKTASNGCVRMTNWSAMAVSKVVSAGTPVTMRE